MNTIKHLTDDEGRRLAEHARVLARSYRHASEDATRPPDNRAVSATYATRWGQLADFFSADATRGFAIVRMDNWELEEGQS